MAQDLWKIMEKHALNNSLKRISKVTVVIGEASGVERDFLDHSLKDHVFPNTIAEGCVIEYKTVPLAAVCKTCSKKITKDELVALACPSCGGSDIVAVSGKEIYVESIEGD